jgi:hypothetical protein
LLDRFPEQPRDLIERAAGSEDAFDAAVSALVMAASLETLPSLSDDVYRIEGKIWRPRLACSAAPAEIVAQFPRRFR